MPRTVRTLLSWVFLALGGLFTLIGLLSFVVYIPTRGGEARDFLLPGLLLLLAGGALLLTVCLKNRTDARLRAEGRSVPGTVLKIQYHPWVRVNQNHPWTVLCAYQWEGETYRVRSALLWREPAPNGQRPAVYLNPDRPQKSYIAPESLQYKP